MSHITSHPCPLTQNLCRGHPLTPSHPSQQSALPRLLQLLAAIVAPWLDVASFQEPWPDQTKLVDFLGLVGDRSAIWLETTSCCWKLLSWGYQASSSKVWPGCHPESRDTRNPEFLWAPSLVRHSLMLFHDGSVATKWSSWQSLSLSYKELTKILGKFSQPLSTHQPLSSLIIPYYALFKFQKGPHHWPLSLPNPFARQQQLQLDARQQQLQLDDIEETTLPASP